MRSKSRQALAFASVLSLGLGLPVTHGLAQEAAPSPQTKAAEPAAEVQAAPSRQQVTVDFFGGEAEYRALLPLGDEIDYLVSAKAGERLHVDVISESGDVVFDILKGDVPLWRAEQGTVFGRELPEDGPWTIRLHAVEAEAASAFRLYLGLDAAGSDAPIDSTEAAGAGTDQAALPPADEPLSAEAAERATAPADIAVIAAEAGEAEAPPSEAAAGSVSDEKPVVLAQAEVTPPPAATSDAAKTDAPKLVLDIAVSAPPAPILPQPDAPPFGSAARPVTGQGGDGEASAPAASESAAAAPAPVGSDGSSADGAAQPETAEAEATEPAGAGASTETPAAPAAGGTEAASDAAEDAAKAASSDAARDAAPVQPAAEATPAEPADETAPDRPAAEEKPVESVASDKPAEPAAEAAPGAAPVAEQPAEAKAGEVSYYRAANLSGAMLNLRRGPSRSEPVVSQVGEGRLLVSSTCQQAADFTWCRVTAEDDPAIWGWAAEQFLTPAAAPNP